MEDNSTKINIEKFELHVHVCIPEGVSLKKVEKAMRNVIDDEKQNIMESAEGLADKVNDMIDDIIEKAKKAKKAESESAPQKPEPGKEA